MRLTPKQEAFAHFYVELGNASEAYRRAYNAENMSPEATWVEASRNLTVPNVALRVKELQERHLASTDATAAQIVARAWEIAQQDDRDRVPALALLAKRHPEFSDKHDITASVRLQALQAVANMTEEQLLRLAEGGNDQK